MEPSTAGARPPGAFRRGSNQDALKGHEGPEPARDGPRHAIITALLFVASLALAFALDQWVTPRAEFIASPFAIPVLIVAERSRPRPIIAAAAITVIAAALSASLDGVPALPGTLHLIALVIISALAVAMAYERQVAAEHARAADTARRQVATILESIADVFFAVDAAWRFTYVNRHAEEYFQVSRGALLGQVLWDALPDVAASALADDLRLASVSREPRRSTVFLGSRERWVEADAYPSGGGLSVYLRDVTERKRSEQEHERLQALAEHRARQMEEFVHLVAHDLRQPLAGAQLHVWMAQRALPGNDLPGRDQVQAALAVVEAALRQFEGMVRELVDSAQLETGGNRPAAERIDLARLLSDEVRLLAEVLDDDRFALGSLPALAVRVDPQHLQRILENLLSNAVRYSPPGSPVTVSLEEVGDRAVVAVADRGMGIAPEDQARIFERGYRAADARSAAEGLGLGLYITRLLVEANGGQVWAESTRGQGSTFFVAFPLAAGASSPLGNE
jgi:PAS domain S-box-containing protein